MGHVPEKDRAAEEREDATLLERRREQAARRWSRGSASRALSRRDKSLSGRGVAQSVTTTSFAIVFVQALDWINALAEAVEEIVCRLVAAARSHILPTQAFPHDPLSSQSLRL